ncbi:MAG: cell envelope integrity protein TolA [Gammaproteobacteria bacterium]
MRRSFLCGFVLLCVSCGSWADWDMLFEVERAGNRIVKSIKTQDTRGNSLVIHRDVDGPFRADLYLNAYLPAPDPVSAAAPVSFTIDGNPPHLIDAGAWETEEPYRRLAFPLSGAPETGLSEALIQILEGKRLSVSYHTGALGQEMLQFALADPGGTAAAALGIATPIDHLRQSELRESRLRMEAEHRAALLNPVDPDAERARRDAIHHQLGLIRERVLDRWMRPAHWSGLRCTLQITLMSTGKVLHVEVVEGSGDAAFDASMAAAVHDASPLPLPTDASLFGDFQRMEMVFDPADMQESRMYSET